MVGVGGRTGIGELGGRSGRIQSSAAARSVGPKPGGDVQALANLGEGCAMKRVGSGPARAAMGPWH